MNLYVSRYSAATLGLVCLLFAAATPAAQAQHASIQSACGADWELPISVKDAKKQTETLTIGQSSSASDAVNATCGEADTPPPPPPGIFGARFLLPDAKSYSAADYRSNGSQRVTWRIVLSGAHSFTFEWDPTALPAGDFWLKDTINGGYVSIDMATTTKYVLTDKTITELVIERYPDGPCIDLPVTAGWNLFSIPLEAYDMRPQALFSDKRARPYGFNAGYEAPAQLATGKGYWMQFKKAATYSICGIYADGGIDVAIGWNLVGPHNQSKPIGSIVKNPSTTVLSSYYGYDGTMFVTDSLKAGRGYWVNSNKVAVLTVGAGKTDADPFSRPFAVRAEDPEWTTLRLTTASGSTQTLFVSQRALSSDETFDYALPPKAPGDVFDARFASGLQVAALFAAPALIELSGVDYPLTLTAENLSDQALYVTDGSGQSAFYTAVQESRPATITEPMGLLRLTLGAEQVGTEDPTTFDTAFALHPGYPNPFSRTTTLKYQLPTSASVRLRVFNALGQIVATLEESIQAPGVYERTFDASALSAGFYYYTLEAGDYRAARTLVLVK